MKDWVDKKDIYASIYVYIMTEYHASKKGDIKQSLLKESIDQVKDSALIAIDAI